jgi:hypothetical protein
MPTSPSQTLPDTSNRNLLCYQKFAWLVHFLTVARCCCYTTASAPNTSHHCDKDTCHRLTMPYNTRRKSLSLPSLGIQLPNGSRAHRQNVKTTTPPAEPVTTSSPPSKKQKRSHDGQEPMSPISSPRSKVGSPALELPVRNTPRAAVEQTPPPSPKLGVQYRKVDLDGINDDIVCDVIQQLEKTGNRPHLIKDLATLLASTNTNIAQ